jgi:hypothetical protein
VVGPTDDDFVAISCSTGWRTSHRGLWIACDRNRDTTQVRAMDDADEELTRLANRQAFEATDQYSETVAAGDIDRVTQLRRLGRAVARDLGWKIHTAAVPVGDE